MNIDGFQKLTLLDYPGFVACIIFTKGCNFRCPYCQNSLLIPFEDEGMYKEEEIFAYLEKRKNVLDGIVISGGEPLMQPKIISFLKKVKELGLLIKVDTNGSNPKLLNEIIEARLVDYIAMDIKNIFNKYSLTVNNKIQLENIKKSIKIIKKAKVDYEFRTTIVKELHTKDDILEIARIVGSESKFYLQNYMLSENVLNKQLHGFDTNEINEILEYLGEEFPLIKVRNGEVINV